MNFFKKITDRYNIIAFVLIVLMGALIFRLSTLTIAQGDYYRDISDNRRLREVSTTAARGEIRDRYGRPLAINKPSFTVQLLKDELAIKDKDGKNDVFLGLIRLLEEDGVRYVDEFPIDLNIFKYVKEEDYNLEELPPLDKVVDIINEKSILAEILLTSYTHSDYSEHYKFITAERAINGLIDKEIDVPISIVKEGVNISLEYKEIENLDKWMINNRIPRDFTPLQSLVELINGDKIIIRKIIDHPIARKLVYEMLVEYEMNENIALSDYSLIYDEEYITQKRILMNDYIEVTPNSSAKNDFINIFQKESLHNLLEKSVIRVNEKGKEENLMPGKILLDMIIEKDKDFPITIELSEDQSTVIYGNSGSVNIGEYTPLDYLIKESKRMMVLESFITDKTIRPLAQEQMLNDGINTKISIANDFEYASINNKLRWYDENRIEKSNNIEEAFESIKEKYGIDKKLSSYESRSILLLYEQLSKQGHMAYQPINIAYGIKDATVAKIEEGVSEFPGVEVSIEPIRYYPEGEVGAHILGYLGKISKVSEIEKYVVENNYSPNDIIGKTGIEESYEDFLKGENGIKRVEVDVFGNTTAVLTEKKPTPGENVYLTMDLELQKVAEASLLKTLETIQVGGTYQSEWGDYKMGINTKKKKPYENATSGATVVVDVKNMEVLAMASYPAYDPNLFSTGISGTDWLSLFPENEKDLLAPRPLYNIATQTAVQPGSVFKMVTGLAGLEKGISATKKIRDMGYVTIGNHSPACWIWNQSRSTHGYENLYEALRDSCNYYFYSLALGKNQRTGEDLGIKVEIEDIIDLAKQLGMNSKTGIEINIPGETSGGVPEPYKKIIATKNLLKSFLRREIQQFINEDVTLDDEEIVETIEEIASWLDLDEILTRGEVSSRLTELGMNAEKIVSDKNGRKENLTDRIKYTYLNQAGWSMSDTLNITIGQGENAYTPIQMAKSLAIMVNGGYSRSLSLVDNVKNYNNSKVVYENKEDFERISLNDYNHLEDIKKGMGMVSTEGTSRGVFLRFPVETGTKTGTAQNSGTNPVTGESYDSFAWFVGFAPYDDPEIAVATIIFQGGSGGYAGPMTRDIIAEYLGLNSKGINEALPFKNKLTE